MPNLIIIAGPNGSGKTAFAREYLSSNEMRFEFINADEIARAAVFEIDNHGYSDIRAARIMLDRIDELVEANADFVVETTLASLTYARKIPIWQARGYNVSLIYLHLGSIAESLARVQKRVEAGGHSIPPEAIKRRFGKSTRYFETIYKPIVNAWYIWESREGGFTLVNSSEPQ